MERHLQKEHDLSMASESAKVGAGRIAKAKTKFMEKALPVNRGTVAGKPAAVTSHDWSYDERLLRPIRELPPVPHVWAADI
jgi:hypothetical protein